MIKEAYLAGLKKALSTHVAPHIDDALEIGGLGMIAYPYAREAVTGKESPRDRERFWELAGLGTLAIPSAKHIKNRLMKKHAEGGNTFLRKMLREGKSKGDPDSAFDPKQLEMGIKIEKEHTTDPQIAKEISKDHLCENEKYYTHLKKMESEAKHGK